MHILHLTPYYIPAYAWGGVVRVVEGLAQAQIAQGHQVTVLTTNTLNPHERIENLNDMVDGVRVVRVPNVSLGLRRTVNLSTPRGMRKVAQSLLDDVDVVHVHEFRTVENLLATPVAYDKNIPLILSPHGTLTQATGRSRLKRWWDTILSSAVALRFDHVVGLTEDELTDVRDLWRYFGMRRIPTEFSVIPNGIAQDDFATLPDTSEFDATYNLKNKLVVLYLGRLHERKGVHLLAESIQQINNDDIRLMIAGPDEGMQEILESMTDSRIIMTGYIEGDMRLQALARADIFALPAIGEGLSMAVLEAMASETAVLITEGCHLPEVAEYNAGLIIERDVASIKSGLEHLINDATLREQQAKNARDLVQRQFTWASVAQQYERVYQQYIKGKI